MSLLNRLASWLFPAPTHPQPSPAYHSGFNDSMNDKTVNPFSAGTTEATDWDKGWKAGEDWKAAQW